MSLSHITITSTTLFTLAAALFVGACDEHATEPTEPTRQVADASPVFHYLGERFTLEELGEAPPHLVFVSADEVHGFDSVEEADEFLRAHAASDRLSAGPQSAAGWSVSFWQDIYGWQSNNIGGSYVLPFSVWNLADVGWGDRISAVYNNTPYTVRFFEHVGFSGNSNAFVPWSICGDLRTLNPNLNDQYSSFYTQGY